jgi:hypothetical protein
MRDISASNVEGHKGVIAVVEAKQKENERLAADAAEKREVARERLAKLARGESVAGGFGKKLDFKAELRAAGFTTRQLNRMRLLAELTRPAFESFLKRHSEALRKAEDKVSDRELRRMIRESA